MFLVSIVVDEASATQISVINPSPSTCIKGKDACVKKISNDILTKKEEINVFLRIHSSAKTNSHQGYNTDALLDKSLNSEKEKVSHSLKLSDVPIVNIGGTDYREFILRINEPNLTINNRDLSKIVLDKLQIFLGNAPNLTNYPSFDGDATKVFDLEENSVLLQDINTASGSYDYFVYIKDSLFTNPLAVSDLVSEVSKGNKAGKQHSDVPELLNKGDRKGAPEYIYLFSQFSNAEGGEEEWAVRKLDKTSIIPVIPAGSGGGSGGALLGSAIAGLGLPQIIGGGKAPSSNLINQPSLKSSTTEKIPVPTSEAPTSEAPTSEAPTSKTKPTETPEPTTWLASLIGVGLILKGRSISKSARKIRG